MKDKTLILIVSIVGYSLVAIIMIVLAYGIYVDYKQVEHCESKGYEYKGSVPGYKYYNCCRDVITIKEGRYVSNKECITVVEF